MRRIAIWGVIPVLAVLGLLCTGCLKRGDERPAAERKPVSMPESAKQLPIKNAGKYASCAAPVGYYGQLKIGMTKTEVKSKLPLGIAPDDLDGPVRYEHGSVERYMNTFPIAKMPLLDDSMFTKQAGAFFQLAFVSDRLVRITIGVPPRYLTGETKTEITKALKSYYSTTKGDISLSKKASATEKARLFWAVQGTDKCIAKAGIAENTYYFKGYLVIDIQTEDYESYLDGKEGDAVTQSPGEIAMGKGYQATLKGFESLSFGMSEKQALSNLPWGLTGGDIPWVSEAKDKSIKLYYGGQIPIRESDPLGNVIKFGDKYITLMLGFTPEGLGMIDIIFETSYSSSEEIQVLKEYLQAKYGEGMYYQYEPETCSELWIIYRHNALAEAVSQAGANGESLSLIVTTYEAHETYSWFCSRWEAEGYSFSKKPGQL